MNAPPTAHTNQLTFGGELADRRAVAADPLCMGCDAGKKTYRLASRMLLAGDRGAAEAG
jgi:hypothetical protein